MVIDDVKVSPSDIGIFVRIKNRKVKNVPIVAICDTNTNPVGVNYVIPSNDDATKTIKLLLNVIKETVLEGKAIFAKK